MPEEAASMAPAEGLRVCDDCATEIAPRQVSCPACGRLVYGDTLRRLAQQAGDAEKVGDFSAALAAWRNALDLLPPTSRQADTIAGKIEELSRRVDASGTADDVAPEAKPQEPGAQESGAHQSSSKWPSWVQGGGVLATAALLAWKLKAVLAFLLTKGKVLLLGLTKTSTLFSMLLSAGLYWSLWGWKFAFGLVLAIYVHEMGHVVALRRFGIQATAPMFIPGLGAVVRLKQYPATPVEDARVGLAGPIWGLGAVVVAALAHWITGWASLAAIARFSAWINLFNLLPVWQLDGGRGFRALDRRQRWIIVAVLGTMWLLTSEGLLPLLVLAAVLRCLFSKAPEEGDQTTLWQFIGLVVVLSWFSTLPVPGLPTSP